MLAQCESVLHRLMDHQPSEEWERLRAAILSLLSYVRDWPAGRKQARQVYRRYLEMQPELDLYDLQAYWSRPGKLRRFEVDSIVHYRKEGRRVASAMLAYWDGLDAVEPQGGTKSDSQNAQARRQVPAQPGLEEIEPPPPVQDGEEPRFRFRLDGKEIPKPASEDR